MLSKTRIFPILSYGVAILSLSWLGLRALHNHSIVEASGRVSIGFTSVEAIYQGSLHDSAVRVQVATPTLVGGYPPLPLETPASPSDPADSTPVGYPVEGPEPTAQLPGAYPPVTSVNPLIVTSESPFAATVTVPANDAALITEQPRVDDVNPTQQRSNSLLLWLGFMLALIVFVIAVVGSILLFARERMSGN